jgi:hypothetical protein
MLSLSPSDERYTMKADDYNRQSGDFEKAVPRTHEGLCY